MPNADSKHLRMLVLEAHARLALSAVERVLRPHNQTLVAEVFLLL